MPNELTDKKITQAQADRMQAPMELDLTAAFKVMEADLIKKTDGFEGTPEGLIAELVRPFNNPAGGLIGG